VLFLCTANYYRSRFSESLFNALAEEKGLRWRAISRGFQTWLLDGEKPISAFTVERLAGWGLHLALPIRFPIQLCQTDLESADLVVALKEEEHRAMMRAQFPAWTDRIQYWHVDDLDCATPDEALPGCEARVQALVRGLLAEQEAHEALGVSA
jgi:protein-tyrosine phosphatase